MHAAVTCVFFCLRFYCFFSHYVAIDCQIARARTYTNTKHIPFSIWQITNFNLIHLCDNRNDCIFFFFYILTTHFFFFFKFHWIHVHVYQKIEYGTGLFLQTSQIILSKSIHMVTKLSMVHGCLSSCMFAKRVLMPENIQFLSFTHAWIVCIWTCI